MITKRVSAEKYRLKAEELRVIAHDVKSAEYRRFLTEIAADYDRMAQSADVIIECRESLASVRGQLTAPTEVPEAQPQDLDPRSAKIIAYRAMATDAERLSFHADLESRVAWLQLARQWNSLADTLECERDAELAIGKTA